MPVLPPRHRGRLSRSRRRRIREAGAKGRSAYLELRRHSSRRWIGRENDHVHPGGGLGVIAPLQAWRNQLSQLLNSQPRSPFTNVQQAQAGPQSGESKPRPVVCLLTALEPLGTILDNAVLGTT